MGKKRRLETVMQILRRKNDQARRKRKIKVAQNATKNENMNSTMDEKYISLDDLIATHFCQLPIEIEGEKVKEKKWDQIIIAFCIFIGGVFIGRFIESIACGHLKF